MSKINFSRIGTSKQPRIRIRILRSWRGYGPGAIIAPPAGARQILLSATDQLGRQVAEIVEDLAPPAAVAPSVEVAVDAVPGEVKRGPGRPRKEPAE